MTLNSRLKALEKGLIKQDAIYCIFVNPPAGTKINNRTVFKSYSDIPDGYLKQLGDVAIFKGIDPGVVV